MESDMCDVISQVNRAWFVDTSPNHKIVGVITLGIYIIYMPSVTTPTVGDLKSK